MKEIAAREMTWEAFMEVVVLVKERRVEEVLVVGQLPMSSRQATHPPALNQLLLIGQSPVVVQVVMGLAT